MKKLIIIITIAASIILPSCGGNSKSDKKVRNEVVELSYSSFISNVWDFTQSPNKIELKGSEPCVIDFYATWCGPCRKVAPIMDTLATSYNGKVRFYKVDVDKEKDLGMLFKVQSIPTIVLIATDGTSVRKVGCMTEDDYRALISKHLNR